MVVEGIVLGHLLSSRGIEVDKAKIEIITSLPHPASVREVRSFLGHAGVSSRTSARRPYHCPNYYKKMWSLSSTKNAYKPLRTPIRDDVRRIQLSPWSRSQPARQIFALDKFRSYLLGSRVIVFSDHAALKYLLKKPDAKP
ncbi:hypothetical protein CR513_05011, partial [Mucuna pruriens]